MSSRLPLCRFLAAGLGVLFFAACQKNSSTATDAARPKADPAAPALVAEKERSPHFAAVNKHLEMGGTVYAYVDIDGDIAKLATGLQAIMAEVAKTEPDAAKLAQKDLAAIARTLGLTDIKALGASSVEDGGGYYRNRVFLYTGGERHGLIAGLGGKPGPFTHLALAPANTTLYTESEIDVPAVYKAFKEVMDQVDGPAASTKFEADLKKTSDQIALSLLDLIYGLKGHSSLVLRLDPEHPVRLPGAQPVTIPGLGLLLSIDGIAPIIEPSLAKAPLKRTDVGTLHVYSLPAQLPFEGIQPVLVVDGGALHLASSLPFFQECHDQRAGLGQNPEFQAALKTVGAEGNGLVYVSPKLFDVVKKIKELNPAMPPQLKSSFDLWLGGIHEGMRPIISVRSNETDGILLRSSSGSSLKPELALASANPVTIGLLAAMAIPAFQKVRSSSQEKAVLNNLRMLDAAADQYYLENGVRTATYDQLVGPEHYVKAVNSVVGEDYRTLRFVQGQPLRVKLQDGRVIEYPPGVVTPAPGAKKR